MLTAEQLSAATAFSKFASGAPHARVWLAGTNTNSGAWLSVNAMVCTTSVLFPQASVASQLRTINWLHALPSCDSVNTTSMAPLQPLANSGASMGSSLPQLSSRFTGAYTTVGPPCGSRTMVCMAVALLPQKSWAVHTRTITSPHAVAWMFSVSTTFKMPQLSVTTGSASGTRSSQPMVTSAGTLLNTGAVVSTTTMYCTCWVTLPHGPVKV